jgi:uncharacterized membrane protein
MNKLQITVLVYIMSIVLVFFCIPYMYWDGVRGLLLFAYVIAGCLFIGNILFNDDFEDQRKLLMGEKP